MRLKKRFTLPPVIILLYWFDEYRNCLKRIIIYPKMEQGLTRVKKEKPFLKTPDENQNRIEEIKTHKFFHETINAFFWFVFNYQYFF